MFCTLKISSPKQKMDCLLRESQNVLKNYHCFSIVCTAVRWMGLSRLTLPFSPRLWGCTVVIPMLPVVHLAMLSHLSPLPSQSCFSRLVANIVYVSVQVQFSPVPVQSSPSPVQSQSSPVQSSPNPRPGIKQSTINAALRTGTDSRCWIV